MSFFLLNLPHITSPFPPFSLIFPILKPSHLLSVCQRRKHHQKYGLPNFCHFSLPHLSHSPSHLPFTFCDADLDTMTRALSISWQSLRIFTPRCPSLKLEDLLFFFSSLFFIPSLVTFKRMHLNCCKNRFLTCHIVTNASKCSESLLVYIRPL